MHVLLGPFHSNWLEPVLFCRSDRTRGKRSKKIEVKKYILHSTISVLNCLGNFFLSDNVNYRIRRIVVIAVTNESSLLSFSRNELVGKQFMYFWLTSF